MKLIALNLPRDLSEQDLEKLFKPYGKVTACTLVLNDNKKASKGFGFVDMDVEAEEMIAIEKLHNSRIKQNKIRVKPAT